MLAVRARGAASIAASVAASVALLSLLARPAVAQLAVDQLELVLSPVTAAAARPATTTPRTALPGPVGVFTVLNDGDAPVQATLRLEDWDRGEDGDNRFFPAGTLAGSCGERLQIFPRSLRLDPHARQSVRVTATGDVNVACWAIVFVETEQPRLVEGRAINYVLRTGVKVYVEPPGLRRDGVVESMRVQEVAATGTADSARALESGARASARALEIELSVRNTGGVHAVARGTVELRRADNTIAATVPVPDLHVLPGARRRVRLALPALAPGRYVALALLDFGGAELAAGQIDVEAR